MTSPTGKALMKVWKNPRGWWRWTCRRCKTDDHGEYVTWAAAFGVAEVHWRRTHAPGRLANIPTPGYGGRVNTRPAAGQ